MGSIRQTLKRLGPAGWVTAFAGVFPGFAGVALLTFAPKLGPWLQSHAPLSALFTGLAFVVVGGLMLAPTYSFSLLCGLSFRLELGLLTAMLAITAAGMLNYAWARVVCKDRVTTLLDEDPRSRAVHAALLHGSPMKTFLIAFLVRLPPLSPFALGNVLFAATKVPFMTVVGATVLGMFPRTAIAVAVGAGIEALNPEMKKNPLVWAAGILVTLGVLGVLTILAKRALQHATAGDPAPVLRDGF